MTASTTTAPQVRHRMAAQPLAAQPVTLPPHSRRCVPMLGLPYVPASRTTPAHLRAVFTAERQRLDLLATQNP